MPLIFLLKNLIRRKGTISGKVAPIFIKAGNFQNAMKTTRRGIIHYGDILSFFTKKRYPQKPADKNMSHILLEKLRTHRAR